MYCKVYIGIFIGVLNTGMSSFQGGWIRGGALLLLCPYIQGCPHFRGWIRGVSLSQS